MRIMRALYFMRKHPCDTTRTANWFKRRTPFKIMVHGDFTNWLRALIPGVLCQWLLQLCNFRMSLKTPATCAWRPNGLYHHLRLRTGCCCGARYHLLMRDPLGGPRPFGMFIKCSQPLLSTLVWWVALPDPLLCAVFKCQTNCTHGFAFYSFFLAPDINIIMYFYNDAKNHDSHWWLQ